VNQQHVIVLGSVAAQISLVGHAAGASMGIAAILVLTTPTADPTRRQRTLTRLALAVVLANVAAFATALVVGRPWDRTSSRPTIAPEGSRELLLRDIGMNIEIPPLYAGPSVETDDGLTVYRLGVLDRDRIEVAVYLARHAIGLPTEDDRERVLDLHLSREPDTATAVVIEDESWPTYEVRELDGDEVVLTVVRILPQHTVKMVGRARASDRDAENMLMYIVYSLRPAA
jgi:hypothetical protein